MTRIRATRTAAVLVCSLAALLLSTVTTESAPDRSVRAAAPTQTVTDPVTNDFGWQ
ncbi:hypothetical protein ABZ926_26665 [Streptomyces litmocidini]|uniref:hypothetical protein n=1 Tax=Streptomyces litmocidini TaxID=67318 RepID=UPI0033F5C84C